MSHLCGALVEHPTPMKNMRWKQHVTADVTLLPTGVLRFGRNVFPFLKEKGVSPRVNNRPVFRADREAKLADGCDGENDLPEETHRCCLG